LEDGAFVNAKMIEEGFAFSYKEYPTVKLTEFNELEQQARTAGRGLWSACNHQM
jgi:endonuclease YncB( thermonuclease family)